MQEKPRWRLLAGGLVILAAVVFGAGIDWGLPSHVIDPMLFGTGTEAATTQLHSYHLTGVGINRLAGSWEENANLAADVAAHPVGDRSKAVTLLENQHAATIEDLVQQGDSQASALAAAMDEADQKYSEARVENNAKAVALQKPALEAQQKVHQYLDQYNREHFGDLSAITASDDVARARILRRYRLYSFQPDEMISFRALAMMHPGEGQFDPKLYQYGGLWIYPVGIIIKAASMLGFVTLTSDTTFYLDSPEQFGRFYILARAYSAVWGIVGVLAVYAIVRRASGSLAVGALAAICFMLLPVVVDLAHEAKPHLAGCSLMLLAVMAAQRYIETGKWRWVIWAGIACGASAGMILWGATALVLFVVMLVARRENAGKRIAMLVVGVLLAALVYFATNPYVAIHLLSDRAVLESNLTNSEAMYGFRPDIVNTIRLIAVGMSWLVAVAGVVGIIVVLGGKEKSLGWLLIIPALIVLVEFFEHSGQKPGEYARFAVFADVALMIGAFLALARISSQSTKVALAVVLVLAAGVYSITYERGFVGDSTIRNTRMKAAGLIVRQMNDNRTLYVAAEPAPYCLPPVNLFYWRMVLLPAVGEIPAGSSPGVLVKAKELFEVMDPVDTPISWAAMGFDVAPVSAK
jgi:hypothetical protein